MSLEEQLAKLTAAVEANTAAHEKLAQVAVAAQGAKGSKPAEDKAEDEKPAPKKPAPKKPAQKADEADEKPAPKKTPTRRAKAKEPTLSADVDKKGLTQDVLAWIGTDDEEERDERKGKLRAALDHVGADTLGKADEADLPRIAAYLAYWQADLEVNFEEIDAKVEALSDDDDGDGDDDLI